MELGWLGLDRLFLILPEAVAILSESIRLLGRGKLRWSPDPKPGSGRSKFQAGGAGKIERQLSGLMGQWC